MPMLFSLDTILVLATPLDWRLSERLGLLTEAEPLFAPGACESRRGLAQAEVSLLCGNFAQTAVLFGGVRLVDPQTEHHLLDLPLPRLERVKVNLGGSSWLAGPGAVAGFVAVEEPEPKPRARVWLGDFGLRGAEASVGNGRVGLLGWAEGFGGYGPGQEMSRRGLGLAWRGGYLGYQDKSFGAQGFYSPTPAWERTQVALLTAGCGSLRFLARFHRDSFALYRDDPEAYWNLHENFSLRASQTFYALGALWGAEVGWQSLWSTRLGSHADPSFGLFTSWNRGPWGAGGRLDWVGGLLAFSFGLWRELGPLTLSLSQSSRFPSYTELYYQSPYNRGNPELSPELAREARLKARLGALEVLAFARHLEGHVAWVKVDSAFEARNLPGFWALGGAAVAKFQLGYVGFSWGKDWAPPLELKYPLLSGPALVLGSRWLSLRWDAEKVLLNLSAEVRGFRFWVENALNWSYRETPWLKGAPRTVGVSWQWSG